jgi:large subunit ribosomal protein L6
MSRIGKRPIPVPAGVDVQIDGEAGPGEGPQGRAERHAARDVVVRSEDGELLVERPSDEPQHRASTA